MNQIVGNHLEDAMKSLTSENGWSNFLYTVWQIIWKDAYNNMNECNSNWLFKAITYVFVRKPMFTENTKFGVKRRDGFNKI